MKPEPFSSQRELVLVGGGHAHVQLLRRFAMAPLAGVQLTLVVDRPLAVYSGMLPGFVAGQYRPEELTIDLVPLAAQARARLVLARAERIDPQEQRLHLAGERSPLFYDVASINIGSTLRDRELASRSRFVLATRPIGTFLERFDTQLDRLKTLPRAVRVVVVGGGAAGVELAACLQARLVREGIRTESLELVTSSLRLLEDLPERCSQRVLRELEIRGIRVRTGAQIAAVEEQQAHCFHGLLLPFDLLVWATGPAAHPLGALSGLAIDQHGFLLARPTLQLEGHDNLFGAGDCVCFPAFPGLAKSGVYAVREGPILERNLRSYMHGKALEPYRPQRDFLALWNLGDGTAFGTKRGFVMGGSWVMRLKDAIDRRFMERFQVDLANPTLQMGPSPMICGGCAAKLEAEVLEKTLDRLIPISGAPSIQVGFEAREDVAMVALSGGTKLAATVDFFSETS